MPPACLGRDQLGFLKRLSLGRPSPEPVLGWQLWMCGWREEVSLAQGPLVPCERRGPGWAREDAGGSIWLTAR